MTILHGIYDHGKIEITDEELPNIRSNVEIRLTTDNLTDSSGRMENAMKFIEKHSGVFEDWKREELHER